MQAKHLSRGAASAMERTRAANFAKFRIRRSGERNDSEFARTGKKTGEPFHFAYK
jgi:hypothetical protein